MDHQQAIREKAKWLLYTAAHDETYEVGLEKASNSQRNQL
jgi:hypothetical protein